MLPTRGVARAPPTRCRNNGPVATATTEVTPRTPLNRPSLVSVGTIVWLSSELMFFAALFAMYFTIRSVDIGLGKPWPPVELDLKLATVNTLVLLLSSVTCQMGVFAIERGQIRRTKSIFNPMSWGLREWACMSGVKHPNCSQRTSSSGGHSVIRSVFTSGARDSISHRERSFVILSKSSASRGCVVG